MGLENGAIDTIRFPSSSRGVQSSGGVKYQQGRGEVGVVVGKGRSRGSSSVSR